MNWIDTPFLVYSLVQDHPAQATVQRELARGVWASSVLVLLEVYQVLTRDYGITPGDAAAAIDRMSRSPLHWVPFEAAHAAAAIAQRQRHQIESADAALLLSAEDDGGTLVTPDRRLLRAAEARGIAIRNFMTPPLVRTVAQWEDDRLPPKGLRRILIPVERWLRREDVHVADRFVEATVDLTALP